MVEFFSGFKGFPKEVKEALNSRIPYLGDMLEIISGKDIVDSGFNLIGSSAEFSQKSSADALLEKDGLLDERDLENNDESELTEAVLDLAYNILDFTGKGRVKIPVSETLYSSIKKEAADESKKEISDKIKKAVSEIGKEILKKTADEVVENTAEKKVI